MMLAQARKNDERTSRKPHELANDFVRQVYDRVSIDSNHRILHSPAFKSPEQSLMVYLLLRHQVARVMIIRENTERNVSIARDRKQAMDRIGFDALPKES